MAKELRSWEEERAQSQDMPPWGRYACSRRVPPPSPRVLLRTRQEPGRNEIF